MSEHDDGDGAWSVSAGGLTICGEAMREIVRRRDGEDRWCFTCRKRREFLLVVQAPVGLSYYGPTPHIECAFCATWDGDLFPGREREWGESA